MTVLVVGEALVDVVTRPDGTVAEVPGGSPANVAVALARLGDEVELLTALGSDPFGDLVRRHVEGSGAKVLAAPLARTAVAHATLDASGAATYVFDIAWQLDEPPEHSTPEWLHVGSIGTVLQPGAGQVAALVSSYQGVCPISFDPNCRPLLTPEPDLAAVEALVAQCDVVKLSDEDARWLLPGLTLEEVLRRWRELGPRLVVVTRGAAGALALTDELVEVPVPDGDPVIDTVGAGDTFMAGLIATRGTSLQLAAAAARITVSRVGADPPSSQELRPSRP
ncbi:MAG: carbohydrate kinase family protein [Mycobacteriales bacterium]